MQQQPKPRPQAIKVQSAQFRVPLCFSDAASEMRKTRATGQAAKPLMPISKGSLSHAHPWARFFMQQLQMADGGCLSRTPKGAYTPRLLKQPLRVAASRPHITLQPAV